MFELPQEILPTIMLDTSIFHYSIQRLVGDCLRSKMQDVSVLQHIH